MTDHQNTEDTTAAEDGAPLPVISGLDFKAMFDSAERVDVVLAQIKSYVEAEALDTSTKEGRQRITSLAYKVSRTKSLLDGKGKERNEEAKRAASAIDALRKKIRDDLDALRDSTRAPLDKWEEAQAERKAKLDLAIHDAGAIASTIAHPVEEIRAELEARHNMSFIDWEDDEAAELERIRAKSVEELSALLAHAEKAEAERAELEELRKMKAEKEAAEAAETQRKAEEEAEAQRKKELEEAAEKARKQAEEDAAAAAAQAQRDADRRIEEANERAAQIEREAAQRIEAEKQKAIDDERARVAEEKRKKDEAEALERERQERRERNQRARNSAGKAIMQSLLDALALDETTAREIATALLDGKIARVKVEI